MDEISCLFCKIARKEIAARLVKETDSLMAFHDINPVAPVHVLIVPKIHVKNINEINETTKGLLNDMAIFAKDLALQLGVRSSGYRLVINNEAGAGQSVFHMHMHLIAGREFAWPPG